MPKYKGNNFCETCPRRLSKYPTEPCPLALQRIEALQAVQSSSEKRKELDELPGCSWYSTSAEHNYCFWNQILTDDPDGRIDPLDDKEIADSLGLISSQVDRTYASGLSKLKCRKNTPAFREMREHLTDINNKDVDNSVYLPDNFIQQAAMEPDELIDEEKKPYGKKSHETSSKSNKKKKSPT